GVKTQYLRASSVVPVSISDLRLDRICGHPPETAPMNFESSRSMVWVTVSLTASPLGSSSIVHSDQPSAFSSGLNSLRQRIASRFGGSNSMISPLSAVRPSEKLSFHDPPTLQSASGRMPSQYCDTNSGVMSADQRR